jgi:hypothetical protein
MFSSLSTVAGKVKIDGGAKCASKIAERVGVVWKPILYHFSDA